MKHLFLFGVVACISCSTSHNDSPSQGTNIDPAEKLKSDVRIQDSIDRVKSDSINKDDAKPAHLGHIKLSKGAISAFNYHNTFTTLQLEDIRRLYRNGFIKSDLYVLDASFDYDEDYKVKFIVNFINLTAEPIKSVQISDIITNTKWPFTNEYYATHRFYKQCNIQPMAVKSVAFLPDNEDIKKSSMQFEKGALGIVYDIDYFTTSGKHFSSSKNITTNLHWEYK